jgi:hypothetical protein
MYGYPQGPVPVILSFFLGFFLFPYVGASRNPCHLRISISVCFYCEYNNMYVVQYCHKITTKHTAVTVGSLFI